MVKKIKAFDGVKLGDSIDDGLKQNVPSIKPLNIRGFVRISDEATGEVLLEKENMITRKGRFMVLTKLFEGGVIQDEYLEELAQSIGVSVDNKEYIKTYPEKMVLLFNVGTKGTLDDGQDVFEVRPPSENESEIESVPFREISTEDVADILMSNSGEDVKVAREDLLKYSDVRMSEDGKTVQFNSKKITKGKWFFEDIGEGALEEIEKIERDREELEEEGQDVCESLEIYKYFQLRITNEELRDTNINQLGLQFCKPTLEDMNIDGVLAVEDLVKFSEDLEIEQFSIFNFPTEALRDTKRLLFEYFIFV